MIFCFTEFNIRFKSLTKTCLNLFQSIQFRLVTSSADTPMKEIGDLFYLEDNGPITQVGN